MDNQLDAAGACQRLVQEYHDKEWGTPVYDDATLFEFLILETFQAFSWITVLRTSESI
jgi:DNA-3-methyladenine glycosylase I